MKQRIVEWFTAVCILVIILVLLTFGGVLITSVALVGFGILGLCAVADVVLGTVAWVSSLFRRSEATTERERRDDG
jgi:TRAP-type C4-dicarboxylate transport system permease small subunit